jgi:hypothetical protein
MALPAYRIDNARIDFEPLNQGINALADARNRYMEQERVKALGARLASGDMRGAESLAFEQGDLDTGMKFQTERQRSANALAEMQREAANQAYNRQWKEREFNADQAYKNRSLGIQEQQAAQSGQMNGVELEMKRLELERAKQPQGRKFDYKDGQWYDVTETPTALPGQKPAEIMKPAEKLDSAQKLRKEFTQLSGDYRMIQDGISRVEAGAAQDSGAGDIALVYGYMKILDPGSVVREGEFATAETAGGVAQQYINLYNKLLQGQRMTPEVRNQFIASAKSLAERKKSEFDAHAQRFSGFAQQYGINPDEVVLPMGAQAPGGAVDYSKMSNDELLRAIGQ